MDDTTNVEIVDQDPNVVIFAGDGDVVECPDEIIIQDGVEVICLDEGADVEEVIVIQDGDDVVCIDGGVEVPVVDSDPTLPSGGGGGVGHAVTGGGFNFDP